MMDKLSEILSEVGPAGQFAALAGIWKAVAWLFTARKVVAEETTPSPAWNAIRGVWWAASWGFFPLMIPARLACSRDVWGDVPPIPEPPPQEPLGDDAEALIEDIATSPEAKVKPETGSSYRMLAVGRVGVLVQGNRSIMEDGKPVDSDYTAAEQVAIRSAAEARAASIEASERAARRVARVAKKGGCDCSPTCSCTACMFKRAKK